MDAPTLEDDLWTVIQGGPDGDSADRVVAVVQSGDDALRRLLAEPTLPARCAERYTRRLYQRNQFLQVAPQDAATLQRVYADVCRALLGLIDVGGGPSEIATLRRQHEARLDEFVRGLWHGPPEAEGFVFADLVCSEYSPELQLQVLGLDPGGLQQPVLDVGCGPGAPLVAALRAQGIDASGLDRLADKPDLVEVGDWLTYDYGHERWGTLISHLGFSNHFLVHDRCGAEAARPYAEAYMAMLRSLAPGGSFHYVPALPFVEEHLPKRVYRVSHRDVAKDTFRGLGLDSQEALASLSRSTRVVRLRGG